VSEALVDLLVSSRTTYDWPAGTGAAQSQQAILDLEVSVAKLLASLSGETAHSIMALASEWAGNNACSHEAILCASGATKDRMYRAVSLLVQAPDGPRRGLDALCGLRGVGLVIASKVYRFCLPQIGAAVDRHASYFFNSLDVSGPDQRAEKATHFWREYADGRRTSTRLATYSPQGYEQNLDEYVRVYLPLLAGIAAALNRLARRYGCAATGQDRTWRPADVEMAAYYWWACHGAR
jgi:hypothetical protein